MKAALIGLGMVSGTYGAALADLAGTVTLAGVYARDPDARARFLRQHGAVLGAVCRAYGSIDEICADPEVDFAILTTPPNARIEIVRALAAAGKPILMEKPVERTAAAAREICDICARAEVPLGIMLQHRMRPAAQALTRICETGALGPLHMVEVVVPWWRDQAYYDEPGRGSYGRDGGGVLISQAIHTLDLMLSITGPVAEATAMVAQSGFHRMEAEDFVSAGLRFASGALGTLFATTASFPGSTERITFHFASASAVLEGNLLTVTGQDGRQDSHGTRATTGAGADPMGFAADWHRDMIADFATALDAARPPRVPGHAALAVHDLIEMLERSGRLGQKVLAP